MDDEEVGKPVKQHPLPSMDRFLKRGSLVLDLLARRVSIGERVINIPPTSFDYLLVLARHAPQVVEYQTLVAEAQGYQVEFARGAGNGQSGISTISAWRLSQMLHNPTYLFNVRGIGYRLIAD